MFLGLTYWSLSSTDKSFETCKIVGIADVEEIDFSKYDSILVVEDRLTKSAHFILDQVTYNIAKLVKLILKRLFSNMGSCFVLSQIGILNLPLTFCRIYIRN